MANKQVNLPITVPVGVFCWNSAVQALCDHFDNEGGHATCALSFRGQKYCPDGVLKAPTCNALEDVSDA